MLVLRAIESISGIEFCTVLGLDVINYVVVRLVAQHMSHHNAKSFMRQSVTLGAIETSFLMKDDVEDAIGTCAAIGTCTFRLLHCLESCLGTSRILRRMPVEFGFGNQSGQCENVGIIHKLFHWRCVSVGILKSVGHRCFHVWLTVHRI